MNNQDNRFLVKFASFSRDSRGRIFEGNKDDFRTVYQRDRDRILHSYAFRYIFFPSFQIKYNNHD